MGITVFTMALPSGTASEIIWIPYEFPITVSEYAYPLTRDGRQRTGPEKIFNQDSDDLQGLITIAMDHDRSSYFLKNLPKADPGGAYWR